MALQALLVPQEQRVEPAQQDLPDLQVLKALRVLKAHKAHKAPKVQQVHKVQPADRELLVLQDRAVCLVIKYTLM